jgi:hypothetical protein
MQSKLRNQLIKYNLMATPMKNISKNKSLFPAKLGILWLVWRSVS